MEKTGRSGRWLLRHRSFFRKAQGQEASATPKHSIKSHFGPLKRKEPSGTLNSFPHRTGGPPPVHVRRYPPVWSPKPHKRYPTTLSAKSLRSDRFAPQ